MQQPLLSPLQRPDLARRPSPPGAGPLGPLAREPTIDLLEIFRLLGRQILPIIVIGAGFIMAGLGYLMVAPARYTAYSTILIDPRQFPPLSQSPSTNSTIDSAYVDSQVEILKSDNIARAVARDLSLDVDPEFVPLKAGMMSAFWRLLSGPEQPPTQSEGIERAAAALQSKLTVKRIGLTYVIQVGYRSLDPEKAAQVNNAVVQSYLVGQLESKYQATRQANVWLQQRMAELKAHAQAAEQAAAEFKSGALAKMSDRATLDDQQLAQLAVRSRTTLMDLESSAQVHRKLYETLLQRSSEALQQSYPLSEARVVAEASAPREKSEPKAILILSAAAAIGLLGGVTAAFARERLNTVFRLPSQVEHALGIRCLGVLPAVSRARWAKQSKATANTLAGDQHADVNSKIKAGSNHRAASKTDIPVTGKRVLARDPFQNTLVIDQTFAWANEKLRFIGADFAQFGSRAKVIGITSALPREGKSLLAATLGELLGDSGRKILVIDCDLRHAGLTRRLAPTANAGLAEVLAGRAELSDVLWADSLIRLDFLPAILPVARIDHPSGVLSSPAMQDLLNHVRDLYDHVILDLPAIVPVADTKAASHLIDSFVLVIESGETRVSAVVDALTTAPVVSERLLGVVLSNAKPGLLARLRSKKGTS